MNNSFRFKVISTTIVLVWLAFIFIPFATIVIGSLKNDSEFYNSAAYAIPNNFTLENYILALTNSGLLKSVAITIFIVTISVVLTSFLSSAVAFVLERFEFRYKKSLVILFLIVSMLPMAVMQVTIFQVMTSLNLYNNILGISILYSVADIVVIYIFREHIRKIPMQIDENALIDGASYIQIYFKLILPNLMPGILIVAMLKMIQIYNDFYSQYLYLPTKRTIATQLFSYIGPYNMDWPVICAVVVLSIVPLIVILIVIQHYNNFLQND